MSRLTEVDLLADALSNTTYDLFKSEDEYKELSIKLLELAEKISEYKMLRSKLARELSNAIASDL
jgi:deoxyhypusine synthase